MSDPKPVGAAVKRKKNQSSVVQGDSHETSQEMHHYYDST